MSEIKILDTFRVSKKGITYKQHHIDRTIEAFELLQSSATEEKIHAVYNQVEDRCLHLETDMKGRIEFDINNLKNSVCEISPIDTLPHPLTLEIAKNYFQLSGTGLQNYKTSKRDYWAQVLSESHCFDVIGLNQEGFLTETSRFNLFLHKESCFYTPPLESGCISGVLRKVCLTEKKVFLDGKTYPLKEKNLTPEDLSSYQLYVGNSLRGLLPAILIR